MGCAVGTVKFAVFIFNFLLVCLGFAMVLFGALNSQMPEEIAKIPDFANALPITSKILIVTGAVIFLVAFFGCWGAVSDSSCLLFLYAVFLIALVLVEIGLGVFVYLHKDEFKTQTSNSLKKWINEYYTDQNVASIVDAVQNNVKCCGVDKAEDWSRQSLPNSCCDRRSANSGSNISGNSCPIDSELRWKEGCLKKIVRLVEEKYKKSMYIVSGIIGVQILTILFALIVRNSILNERRRTLA